MDKVDGDVQRIAKQRVWSEAEGKRIVAAWRRSGESRAAFARRYGIPVHRLYYRITTAGARSPVTERGVSVRNYHVTVGQAVVGCCAELLLGNRGAWSTTLSGADYCGLAAPYRSRQRSGRRSFTGTCSRSLRSTSVKYGSGGTPCCAHVRISE